MKGKYGKGSEGERERLIAGELENFRAGGIERDL